MNKARQDVVSGRKGKKSSRSIAKPLIAMSVLIVLAVGVAVFLIQRNQERTSNPHGVSSALTLKPVVTPKGWTKGNLSAKTVLIEFGDFQCAACAAARITLANVLKKHENELLLVFKHFPLEAVHRNSVIAAQAAEAAGKQFKFWEMYDMLFEHQQEWANVPDPQTFFLQYAAQVQLDLERFRQDLWDGQIRDKIFRDILEGQFASVKSVPTFFLNGSPLPRPEGEAHFEEMITNAIKSAK